MRIIANQVDIEFNATVNDTQVDALLKKLKEIESTGIIDLKSVGADIKSAKKELQDLQNEIKKVNDLKVKKGSSDSGAKEQEKINKNILEQERAKQQIILAQNKELIQSEKLAKEYLDTLKKGNKVSAEDWAKLKTKIASENQTISGTDTYKKYLTQQHTEALAMDKLKNAEKKNMEQAHSNAIIENKKREVSKNEQLEKLKLAIIKTNLGKQYEEELKLLQKKKNISQKEITDFKKKVDLKMAQQQGSKANFTEDISNLMFFRQTANYIIRAAKDFEKFEDSLFQTGIVAGRSAMEIRAMRQEVLELGLNIPRATQDILDNITAVQRTGRSYEEAGQIINKSAKLAVSSGESIALSTDVLNKALIAFNINVSDTAEVMNIFHSASIRSPLDLKKISDGLKNSASSMRNFIESTDKSGQELEDYKMRILGMTTALLAGQSALGRQASSSGMSIRTNTNVLFLSDKVA